VFCQEDEMSGRKLTNKQLLVLDVVRRHPEGLDAKTVATKVTEEAVEGPCSKCDATGKLQCRVCWACDGTGQRKPFFYYGDAYQALKRLRSEGLIERRCKRDEWGDELALHVYFAAAAPDADDPLERAFNAPAYVPASSSSGRSGEGPDA
jgi:RecJ-like exonuclease